MNFNQPGPLSLTLVLEILVLVSFFQSETLYHIKGLEECGLDGKEPFAITWICKYLAFVSFGQS